MALLLPAPLTWPLPWALSLSLVPSPPLALSLELSLELSLSLALPLPELPPVPPPALPMPMPMPLSMPISIPMQLKPPLPLLLAAICLAFWPVWIWFANGTLDGSNDAGGLLAAAVAIAIVTLAPTTHVPAAPLLLPTVCVALYLLMTAAGLPMLSRAMMAALAIASFASAWRMGKRLDVALLALCTLALPLAASLQFYVGYPLRVVAGAFSALLLRMNGLAVVREGAMLAWDGQLIAIDAPCSGIKMLWSGLFLACALAASARLPALRTMAAMLLAAAVVIAANSVRAAALFYMETGLVHLPAWAHPGIGVLCFAGAALAILWGVSSLMGRAA